MDEAQVRDLLKVYFAERPTETYEQKRKLLSPPATPTSRMLLEADAQTKIIIIRLLLREYSRKASARSALLNHLCRFRLPYTLEDIQAILQDMCKIGISWNAPVQKLLRSLSYPLASPENLAACRTGLEDLRKKAEDWIWHRQLGEERRFFILLDTLLAGEQTGAPAISTQHAWRGPDTWGMRALSLLETLEPACRDPWLALLRHCAKASNSAPSRLWLTSGAQLVEMLGNETFRRLTCEWIDAFGRHRGESLTGNNAALLKGLAWCSSVFDDPTLASSLADAAIEGYRKIPGYIPRAPSVSTACIYSLERMPGIHGTAQLERVRLNVKQPMFLRAIEKALEGAAHRAGMSRDDLVELTVPTFDLQERSLRLPLGPLTALVGIEGSRVVTRWYDATGKQRTSLPDVVRREHKTEIKELKRLTLTLAEMLGAQRDRLERLPLLEKHWVLAQWRERYRDHPLVGCLARRLIWRFREGERVVDGVWFNGQLVDAADTPLALSEDALVSTWHPVFCNASQVLAWREWFERHSVTQPFKQAHREVYLLTEAERATRTYSNRFAAHILRQVPFHGLATNRGWRNQLHLGYDDGCPPAMLVLPHWGVRAEFWVGGTGDMVGTGTYQYVTTNQVRFYPLDAPLNSTHYGDNSYEGPAEPLPLEQLSPLLFSEVMRDVDLFIGVTSIGNDPTWQDGGPRGLYSQYWREYSFGELGTLAQARKDLLSRLLPQLALAKNCTIEGRFLKVRGTLRTYKIHLGSGNILMEPNDQYLCIVQNRGKGDGIFLPFEGDAQFALILSKAFLLSEDARITDPTITRQIGSEKR